MNFIEEKYEAYIKKRKAKRSFKELIKDRIKLAQINFSSYYIENQESDYPLEMNQHSLGYTNFAILAENSYIQTLQVSTNRKDNLVLVKV